MTKPLPPNTSRGKIVYFIWNNLPRFVLLIMIALIFVLYDTITEQTKIIAAKKAEEVKPEKPPVNTVLLTLAPKTITDRINLPGAIEPWTRLRLMAKIGGTIDEVMVTEGSHVKKGDVLARIEDADYRIALDRADAAYKLARNDFERDKKIYEKGVIPTATLDTNKTAMQTAKADYDNAKLMLSRTIVTSPMDGIIRRLDAKVGLQLAMGDPIAEILEIDRVKAVIGIPESDVTAVRKLTTVNLTVQALEDRKVQGKIHFLSPAPDTTARLYNLELAIDNSQGEILPGMFVRADIVKNRHENSIVIPFYSVISRNDEQYVYVEENGLSIKKNVSLGIMENWMVQVIDGLSVGENLVVEGHRDVENGQKINVIKTLNSMEDMGL
ncbi:efflux RND transporter periplasmic adaptor subunit [Desulforhopalus sp. IMCC35007]|uniref:efflux RND transporter periplasmic adaptor subunit n=1 Tax=Desulforhopalus sp. IMCC35007 TaxID=2569543 RepID=UPI00145D16A4|nr:efflux RND transporter periplasmic adaptor subunit [Desulforhopalus sp. IMCC35007]